jgi:hypothetical protein
VLLTDLCAPVTDDVFDAVIARGVLNDLLTDQERSGALTSFARLTGNGGILVLDVREAEGSQRRADGRWRATDVDLSDGRRLRFVSRPTWKAGRILVEERYELACPDAPPSVNEYNFEMRPWTRDEIRVRLSEAGYERIQIRAGVGRRTRDRIFVTAHR